MGSSPFTDTPGPRPFLAAGIDVGGTKIAAGLVTLPDGQCRSRHVRPTLPRRGGRAVLDEVLELGRALSADAAEQGWTVGALGLGVCELVDREGRLASAHTLDWQGLPVASELSAVAPVTIEADVRAAALAAHAFGPARESRCFLYVTIGTGISCCLMLDGRPHLGARGATGTMASSPSALTCPHCERTSRLPLEDLASGPALVSRFQARGGRATGGPEVLEAARSGDALASEIVGTAAGAVGTRIGWLINVLDPEIVVIGGGLGTSPGPYWDGLVDATRREVWSDRHRDLPIVRDSNGPDAGWIGAAVAAWRGSTTELPVMKGTAPSAPRQGPDSESRPAMGKP